MTTSEPYAVCCIQGIKVSLGMHNFGEKRWGLGLLDDFRSHSDSNMRIVGDFTKSVHLLSILERMSNNLNPCNKDKRGKEWIAHFHNSEIPLPELIKNGLDELKDNGFVRKRLQTRFFELGDTYYLGKYLYSKLKKDGTSHAPH